MPNYVSRAGRGFVLIGPLLAGLCLFLAGGTTRARAAGTPPKAAPIHTAFLGDSYTFGVGATEPTDGYAYFVSRAEAWTSRVVGLPGSREPVGSIRSPSTGSPAPGPSGPVMTRR